MFFFWDSYNQTDEAKHKLPVHQKYKIRNHEARDKKEKEKEKRQTSPDLITYSKEFKD